MRSLFIIALLSLSGCAAMTIASTAMTIATLPVKVASAGIDAVTTSQSEADEKRGREQRKMLERCRKGKPRPEDLCPKAPQ